MTFVCPVCNEISSGKHKKQVQKKTGKTWRERQVERSVMPTAVLGYNCPCCKELRTMEQYNPFETWKTFGKKKPKKVAPLKKLHRAKPKPKEISEVTTLTAQGMAISSNVAPSQFVEYRTFNKTYATVSWDDTAEMRRFILKQYVLKAVERYVITMQCAIRCWTARLRVQRKRESVEASKKRSNKTSFGKSSFTH